MKDLLELLVLEEIGVLENCPSMSNIHMQLFYKLENSRFDFFTILLIAFYVLAKMSISYKNYGNKQLSNFFEILKTLTM